MARSTNPLGEQDRRQLNQLLAQIQELEQEALKAENARIRGMDSVISRCKDCQERIALMKETYFPGKR